MAADIIRKSDSDSKEYRLITLKNGIRALLISDRKGPSVSAPSVRTPLSRFKTRTTSAVETHDSASSDMDESDTTESVSGDEESDCPSSDLESDEKVGHGENDERKKQAAASLCINVGSFSDPAEIPGLAHFLEHMVFMGSEKYPDENKFDAFIRLHGGSDNASTDCERTVFQFEIQPQQFRAALDIWAQFFIAPLLKQDSVDREVKAVDSEFDMALNSDECRKEQLLGAIFPRMHPMSKFMWGNKRSLMTNPAKAAITVYDSLKDFYKKYYSSHFMTLAVQSPEELDTMEEWVKLIFSDIPHNGEKVPSFKNVPKCCIPQKIYKIEPVRNIQELELVWILPPQQQLYKTKPLHYISWLMGHEGKGSILSLLKNKNLALELCCGNHETGFEQNETCSLFCVTVTLTEKGYISYCEVMDTIFQYLAMLSDVGPNERVFKEIQKIEDIDFRFQEEEPPIENVVKQCVNVLLYPEEDILTGDSLLFDYQPDHISNALRELQPHNCVVFLSSPNHKSLENIEKETWFGTSYAVEDIPEVWMTKWMNADAKVSIDPNLHLPGPNNFIAEKFEIKCERGEVHLKYPRLISAAESGYKLWYKQDHQFRLPKAYIRIHLFNPLSLRTPQDFVCLEVLVHLLIFNLAEVAYDADAASLTYGAEAGDAGGLTLKFSGYNDKLPALVDAVTDNLVGFKTNEDDFKQRLLQHTRSYYNDLIKPNKLGKNLRLSILEKTRWSSVDKYKACSGMTFERFSSFVKEFLSSLYVESLIQGNYTEEEATGIIENFVKNLNCALLTEDQVVSQRVLRLGKSHIVCKTAALNPSDDNSMVTTYYQVGPNDTDRSAAMLLLEAVMDEPCFNTLRTIKQLGYSVFVQQHNTSGILGLSVNVGTQNSKFSVEATSEDIAEFVTKEMNDLLNNMKDEVFKAQVASVIAVLKNEDSHLGEEVDRNWHEIVSRDYVFDRVEREIKYLESCTLANLCDFFASACLENDKVLHVLVKGNSPEPVSKPIKCEENVIDDGLAQKEIVNSSGDADDAGGSLPSLKLVFLQYEGDPAKKPDAIYVSNIEKLKIASSFYQVTHVQPK